MNDGLSWWEINLSGSGALLKILGLITILALLLWWAIKQFKRIYRWYLTRGDDEERMQEELELQETIGEEYLDSGDEDERKRETLQSD